MSRPVRWQGAWYIGLIAGAVVAAWTLTSWPAGALVAVTEACALAVAWFCLYRLERAKRLELERRAAGPRPLNPEGQAAPRVAENGPVVPVQHSYWLN